LPSTDGVGARARCDERRWILQIAHRDLHAERSQLVDLLGDRRGAHERPHFDAGSREQPDDLAAERSRCSDDEDHVQEQLIASEA
jgi:hypothetical protein